MIQSQHRRISRILVILTIGLFAWHSFWAENAGKRGFCPDSVTAATKKKSGKGSKGSKGSRKGRSAPAVNTYTAAYERGMKEYNAGQLISARTDLCEALSEPGEISADQAAKARRTLTDLAQKTLLNKDVIPGDRYAFIYTTQNGDTIRRITSKATTCQMSPEFILKLNGLNSNSVITAGMQIKFVRGPVSAYVDKGSGFMDLWLYPSGFDPVYVKRLPIGVGNDRYVPQGFWSVSKKATQATFIEPGRRAKEVRFGEADYPLNRDGHLITLAARPYNCMLHTTRDGSLSPDDNSYIVLKQNDLLEVYNLFVERASMVYVAPQR